MKHITIYSILLCLISLSSCRDRPGLIMEVTGRVFADSSRTVPAEDVEIVILDRNALNQRIPARYEIVSRGTSDEEGNYSVFMTTEDKREYYVWVRPDPMNHTSAKNTPKLNEWEINEVDFILTDPIDVRLVISEDSLILPFNDDMVDGRLTIVGYHRVTYPGLSRRRGNVDEIEFPLNGDRDTVINLVLERSVEYRVSLKTGSCDGWLSYCEYLLNWTGETPDQDSTTIILQQY